MPNGTCNKSDDTYREGYTEQNNNSSSSVCQLTTTPKRAAARTERTNVEDHHKERERGRESEHSGERAADNGDAADDSLPG